MKKGILLFLFLTVISITPYTIISAQGFDLTQYQNFLQSHQNMETGELLQMYPAGIFQDNLNQNYQDIFYFDSIDAKYNLTGFEKSLIHGHGFMVSQRLSQESFGQILLDIHHNDLPVFVSTDAILYAYHVSYDRILREVELGYLIGKVDDLLTALRNSFPQLVSQYSSIPEMVQMLMDADFYITVGSKLIGENINPYYSQNNVKINSVISRIMAADTVSCDTLFSSDCVVQDWSQFKPRGHYDSEEFPELKLYFRTMMWLGRIELYLIQPSGSEQSYLDTRRQIIDANIIYELFDLAGVHPDFENIEDVLQFFVGHQDNVTLDNMGYLRNAVQITTASQLLDSLKIIEFQDTLSHQSFANQLILSQILSGNPFSPDSIVPASAFLLFGQRYVDDSYVTASVVYDRITYLNQTICRLFPSALDPMFALGNDAAAQLLIPELNTYHYSTNLAALRYLFDSFPTAYWDSSMYKRWLYMIKTLNPPDDRGNLPPFMTTAAYWQEKLNTQLSSWAELRHDNLLYAKQSYTGVPICSYPYSYVEPFPEFYAALKNAGSAGYNYFQNIEFLDNYKKQQIMNYFYNLQYTCDTLKSISEKELDDTPLSPEETEFLKNMMFEIELYSGGSGYDGWYPRLIFEDDMQGYDGLMGENYIVADIHTTPADCGGSMMGWITHVGTGPVDMGVFIAKMPGGVNCAFVGPVLSYREYVTTNFLRLTDDEWSSNYMFSSSRPNWVNLYLADSTGNSRGEGGELITSDNPDNKPHIPTKYLTVSNYPNPFNPGTIISFTVPYDLSNQNAELTVYDIQGQAIKHLINRTLPAGNYVTKWYGNNDSGSPVSSGVYIYRLRIGDRQGIGKMNLIR